MKKQYTNPFIRSPEKIELDRQLSNYLIWLHMLDDGHDVGDGFVMLRVLCDVCAQSSPDEMSQAIAVIEESKQRGTWRKADLVTLVKAIIFIHEMPMMSKQDARRVLQMQGVAA